MTADIGGASRLVRGAGQTSSARSSGHRPQGAALSGLGVQGGHDTQGVASLCPGRAAAHRAARGDLGNTLPRGGIGCYDHFTMGARQRRHAGGRYVRSYPGLLPPRDAIFDYFTAARFSRRHGQDADGDVMDQGLIRAGRGWPPVVCGILRGRSGRLGILPAGQPVEPVGRLRWAGQAPEWVESRGPCRGN